MPFLKIPTVVFTTTGVPEELLLIITNVPPELNSNNQQMPISTHAKFRANPSAMSKSPLIATYVRKPGNFVLIVVVLLFFVSINVTILKRDYEESF